MNLSRRPSARLASSPESGRGGRAAVRDTRKRCRKSPLDRFKQQRNQARQRGIAWELSFEEWMSIWIDSGRWEQRGNRSGGFVMGRYGDVGPYSAANVEIIPHEQNIADGSRKNAGRGRGWTYVATARRRPYQVVLAHRYVGSYATQAEAEAAHRLAVEKHRALFFARKARETKGN